LTANGRGYQPFATAAGHAARVRQINGHDGNTTRQTAYDLRTTPRQAARRQAWPDLPLPRPAMRHPYHQHPAHPPRPCHSTNPRRRPQPPHGP